MPTPHPLPPATSSGHVEGNDKVRFVGKHSKDANLSIYLQKRNIYEVDGPNGPVCEPLGCIVRIKQDKLPRERVVVVGILARIVCDFGLQYTEHVLYQLEAQLYPRANVAYQPHPDQVGGGVFDFETRFVTALPDDSHIPFLIKLPTGLPPSVYLRNGGMGGSHWGLTFYVFAYTVNERAAQSTVENHGIEGAWPRMRLGRRYSKVFLSFSKTNVAAAEKISRSMPPSKGMNRRKSFLSSAGPLVLEASLDKFAYYAEEPIKVTLRIKNVGRQRISGIRITLKQLLTIKFGSEPRQVIKTTISEYEGHEQQVRDTMSYETTVDIDSKFGQNRAAYQIALEARLPQLPENPKLLSASCAFSGTSFHGIHFGIEKLKIFAIEYYVNVHAIIPWSSNVIVKLPLHLISLGGHGTFDRTALPPTISAGVPVNGYNREKKTMLANGQPATSSFKGNLIAFDFDPDANGDGDDNLNDPMDADDEEKDNYYIHPVDKLFSNKGGDTNFNDKTSKKSVAEGVSWDKDILTAKAILESTRSAVNEAHKKVLDNKLDRRTLLLQLADKRLEMSKTIIECLYELVFSDAVNLRASLQLIVNTPSARQESKFYTAQAIAFKLGSIGGLHAEFVPLVTGTRRDLVDERLEGFSRILDDFELLLVRAERALTTQDEALLVLDRLIGRAISLLDDLPGYTKINASIKALAKQIISRKWTSIKSRNFKNHVSFSVNGSDSEEDDQDDDNKDIDNGNKYSGNNDLKDHIGLMARQFQELYDFEVVTDECDAEGFVTSFSLYCKSVRLLLSSDSLGEIDLGVVAYFNWKFLTLLAKRYFVGIYTTSSELAVQLLFSQLSEDMKWNKEIESKVPARFILANTITTTKKMDNDLEDIASHLVSAMQKL